MKKLVSTLLFTFLLIFPVFGETPHLMLYFDINKTLIASDKAGGKSAEDILNQILAAKVKYRWDSSLNEPISYEEYVKTILLPSSGSDVGLKAKRNALLSHFIPYLEESNHPLYPETSYLYQSALNELQKSNSIVFNSFYTLLKKLDEEGVSYTLFLRSYGSEIYELAEEINLFQPTPLFHIQGTFQAGTLHLPNNIEAKTPKEIYETLRTLSHAAIRDDWEYWVKNKQKTPFAKPFYIDLSDSSTLSIFFDDNIDPSNEEENIIAPQDVSSGKQIPISQLIEKKQAIQVDTLEAILNKDYFYQQIQEAIEIMPESR